MIRVNEVHEFLLNNYSFKDFNIKYICVCVQFIDDTNLIDRICLYLSRYLVQLFGGIKTHK